MTQEAHKTVQYSLLFAAVAIICYVFMHREPSTAPIITKETVKLQPIIIEGKDWQPVVIEKGRNEPYIPQNNDSLRKLYIALFEQNSQSLTYDTTFADTNYTEHLTFKIKENKLDKFTRELTIINTNTAKLKVQTFGIYGGLALHNITNKLSPAFVFTFQPRQGSIYTIGKDATGAGFFLSVQIPIYRHFK